MTPLIQKLIQENSKEYKSDLFKLLTAYVQNVEEVSKKDKEMFNRMEILYEAIEEEESREDLLSGE